MGEYQLEESEEEVTVTVDVGSPKKGGMQQGGYRSSRKYIRSSAMTKRLKNTVLHLTRVLISKKKKQSISE